MPPIYRGLILVSAFLAAGCAPRPHSRLPIEHHPTYALASFPPPIGEEDRQTRPPLEPPSKADVVPCPPQFRADSTYFDLGNEAVDPYLSRYLEGGGRRSLENALNRSQAFVPRFQRTLEAEGLPPELAYLPIVESHFKNTSLSHAGAAGLWQFMPRTAKRYGLRVDRCIDERRDPQLATQAAARYLGDLYDRFEDWHLALAAYNAGEGTVSRALRENGVDDYWAMAARGLLPRETCHFVPKFLAAVTVAQNAPDLGFDLSPDAAAARPSTFTVEQPISLATVAKLAGTDLERIRELNPALRCGRIPSGGYSVRIPANKLDRFRLAYANLDTRTQVARADTHRVRRGDSPASIARRYGVSVNALMRANGIRNPRHLRVNTRLTIPGANI